MLTQAQMDEEAGKMWDVGMRFIKAQEALGEAVAFMGPPSLKTAYGEFTRCMEAFFEATTQLQNQASEELREARALVSKDGVSS